MTTDPAQLLASLGSGVRPVEGSQSFVQAPIESWDFDQLLNAAEAGTVRSGRTLHLAGDAERSLSDDQARRLMITADAAEAGGLGRVAALIDDLAVDLDVADRTVGNMLKLGASDGGASLMRAPFDGVAMAPGEQEPGQIWRGLGRGVAPGVLEALGLVAGDEKMEIDRG